MPTYQQKTRNNSNKRPLQKKGKGNALHQLKDNRQETTAQRKIQKIISESPQVQKATQLQAIANAPNTRPVQKKANRTGLPDNLKSGIENLSGHSMDDVRVHYNSSRPTQLNAHAFAQGTNIHVASGQEKHLPHEAWHVVQQKQGRVQPTMQMRGVSINDNAGLEKEADVMGGRALSGTAQKKENGQPKQGAQSTEVVQGFFFKKTVAKLIQGLQSQEAKMNSALNKNPPKWEAAAKSYLGAYGKMVEIHSRQGQITNQQATQVLQIANNIDQTVQGDTTLQQYIKAIDVSAAYPKLGVLATTINATSKFTSPLNPGAGITGIKAGEAFKASKSIKTDPKVNLSAPLKGTTFGLGVASDLASVARVGKATHDLVTGKGPKGTALAEMGIGSTNVVKSSVGIAKQGLDWAGKGASKTAGALGVAGGVAGAAAGTFVAARNTFKSIKAIARTERLRKLKGQVAAGGLAERARSMGRNKAAHKATVTAIAAAGGALAAAGSIALLASNPVGWALAAAGALVGLSIAGYRLGRWAIITLRRRSAAKNLARTFLAGVNNMQNQAWLAAASRIQSLGISINAASAMSQGALKNLIIIALKNEKQRVAYELFSTYKRAVDKNGNGLTRPEQDAILVVQKLWSNKDRANKLLKNKDGSWKSDGFKTIFRKLQSF
ncbi:MAG: DUF4157 domain-containing protein [Bacteroidota bacterium]